MNVKLKRLQIFNRFFFLILLSVNVWIFIDRDNNFAYKEVLNYNQLYADTVDIQKWKQTSPYTTQEEINTAKNILKDSVQINNSENSIQKISKIGSYVLAALDNHRGQPADCMKNTSPLKEFFFASNNKSEVWCGNFANIFSFFANTAGIPTRYVAEEGNKNNQHVLNECFVKELNQWVLVDLTSKIILAKNKWGNYLNTIDLYHAHILKTDSISVSSCENKISVITGYSSLRNFYDSFFDTRSLFVFYLSAQFDKNLYSVSSKIKRYFTKSPTFACYENTNISSNNRFYVKIFSFYLFFAFVIYWIAFSFLTNRMKK